MKLKIFRKDKDIPLPEKMTDLSAGMDVRAAEDVALNPNEAVMVPTGLIIQCPEGYHIKLFLRSSLAYKHRLMLGNGTGIIDEDYCGESDYIGLIIHSSNPKPIMIEKGERIGQIMFEKNQFDVEWDEQDMPGFAGKSRGGFGSTGEK